MGLTSVLMSIFSIISNSNSIRFNLKEKFFLFFCSIFIITFFFIENFSFLKLMRIWEEEKDAFVIRCCSFCSSEVLKFSFHLLPLLFLVIFVLFLFSAILSFLHLLPPNDVARLLQQEKLA